MPTFKFTSPDGKQYSVNGPDGATQEQAFQMLQTQIGAPKAAEPERSWGDTLGSMVKSVPGSLADAAVGIGHAVLHPLDTAKSIVDIGAGELQKALPDSLVNAVNTALPSGAAAAQEARDKATNVNSLYKQNYGTEAGFKNKLAADPAGVAMDIATVLTGGGGMIAKAPGLAKAGNLAIKAGQAIDPIANSLALAGKAAPVVSGTLESGAKKLMQSAVKPTIAQLKSGDAATAVQTLLDYGINPTAGGVEKLKSVIEDLNGQIGDSISNSTASVDKQKTLNALGTVREKFSKQVNPTADLKAIDSVAEDFSNHPYFQSIEAKGPELQAAVDNAAASKAQALQAAGKLKTFAAQQQELAKGKNVALSPNQPENQLYFNVGGTGGEAISPTVYPAGLGMPKAPARYTPNMQRVAEGEAGAQDAMTAYAAKRAEQTQAENALADWQSTVDKIPVQTAQDLKQGTYKILSKKYGQVGTAETEAQKGLARGLKEEIASAVPGVAELNAEESKLITTLNVTERRALMELNKNPAGLASLAHSPAAWATFMADKSALFKSLAARVLNSTSDIGNGRAATTATKGVNALADQLGVTPAVLTNYLYQMNQANQASQQK